MARRQVSIFIDGKPAARSIQELTQAKKKANRELNRMIVGSEEYNKKLAEVAGYNRELQEHRDRLRGTARAYGGLNAGIGKYVKLAAGAFAADRIIEFGKELFRTGSEMELLSKKAATVFGQTLPSVSAAARESAASLGLTESGFIDNAASIADLLVPMKFTREEAAGMSVNMIELSGALSEWTGGQRDATEVSNILAKAMLGEREELKSLGIAINEEDVKNRLRKKGLEDLTGEYLQQAKAISTLELIMEKSQDAQTAFAENSDTLVRRQAELNAKLTTLKERIATVLVPIFERLLDVANLFANGLANIVGIFGSFVGKADSATTAVSRLQREFNLEIETLKRGNLSQEIRARLIDEINDKYGAYLPNLIDEKDSISDIAAAQDAANKAFQQKIILIAAEERLANVAKQQIEAKERELELQRELTVAIEKADRASEIAAQRGLSRNNLEFGDSGENRAIGQLAGVQEAIRQNIEEQRVLREEYEASIAAASELGLNIENILTGNRRPDNEVAVTGGGGGNRDDELEELRKHSEKIAALLDGYQEAARLAELDDGERRLAELRAQFEKEIDLARELEAKGVEGATAQRLELERIRNQELEKLQQQIADERFAKIEEQINGEFEEEQRVFLENLNAKRQAESEIKSATDEALLSDQELAILRLEEYYRQLRFLAEEHGLETAKIEEAFRKQKAKLDKDSRDQSTADQTAELKKQADELAKSYGAMASIVGSAYELLSAAGLEATTLGRFLALTEIGLNSARGVAAAVAAGAGLGFPQNLGAIAAGVSAVLGGIAQATSILESTPEVPQRFVGGYFGVRGEDDGRYYNAQYLGHRDSGMLPDRPVLLASERGREYLVANHLLREPAVLNHVRAIENIRRFGVAAVPQFVEGGFTGTPPAEGSNVASSDVMQLVSQLLPVLGNLNTTLLLLREQGIPAVIGDDALIQAQERTQELAAAGGGVLGG